jgi:hypothetical protein
LLILSKGICLNIFILTVKLTSNNFGAKVSELTNYQRHSLKDVAAPLALANQENKKEEAANITEILHTTHTVG